MSKESFIFYNSIYLSLAQLTDDRATLDAAMGAVVRYAVTGEDYKGDNPYVNCAMIQAKPLIDANKRKTNSGGPGAPKRGKRKVSPAAGAEKKNLSDKPMVYDKETIGGDVDVDIDKDKDVEVEVDKEGGDDIAVSSSTAVASAAAASQKKAAVEIKDYYNSQVKAHSAKLRECTALTPQREGYVLARLRDYGVSAVKATIDKAIASHFLNYGATNAPVNFEWIFRPNNFLKIMEGSYDNKDNGGAQTDPEYGRLEIGIDPHKFDKYKNGNGWPKE